MAQMFLFFGSSVSFLQLAFGGVLNAIYSISLLAIVALAWRSHSKMREAQQDWYNQWESVAELCHKQFDEIKEVEQKELMGWMKSGWLTDLSARLDSSMGLPSAEQASSQMMLCALHGKPFLFEKEDLSEPWERLPGLAILLGLLGTFIGLTLALTQLPFRGNLKELTGGLQIVLPLMGTAFWTSVCGLMSSLMLRFIHSTASRFQLSRVKAYERLQDELGRRCLRELFPLLTKAGLTGLRIHSPNESETKSPKAQEEQWKELLSGLSRQQETLLERFSEVFSPLQEQLLSHGELLQAFPTSVEGVTKALSSSEVVLTSWQEQLHEANQTFGTFAAHANEAVSSIAHSERLLSERVTTLSKQQEALTASIEAMTQREDDFPAKLKEILTFSLRPAHLSLQQTTRGLQGSLELIFERDQQERETQRRLFQDLGERFAAVDRLTSAFEKSAREIRQISDTLLDLSNRLRFRLAIEPEASQVPEENPGDRALDQEIEQLLEGFDNPDSSEGAGGS